MNPRPSREAISSMLHTGLLARLEAAWRAQDAPIAGRLAPGLTEDEMDEITRPLGLRLPLEARIWWGWHDGVPWRPGGELTPERWMGPELEYQPLRDAVDAYLSDRALFADIAGDPEPFRPAAYFPVTRSSGPILCDCGAPEGSPSPIYYVHTHDSHPESMRRPVARSFGEMVGWWIDALNDGAWRWDGALGQWKRHPRLLEPRRELSGLV